MDLTEQAGVLLLVQLEHKAEKREVQKLKELRQLSVLPEQPTQLFFMPKFLQICSSAVCTTEGTGDESVVVIVIAGKKTSPRCEGNELAEASDDSD
ncbi:hypothetical protein QYF36_016977 [Acer negundo]|nr:hypothetical protein Q3G72_007842 [Acer saccharum]KAK4838850.1 hypothetical protein QYF36_016977 [Acer negundo]